MSKVPAHYELIQDIIKLRDEISPQTKLIINGDVRDRTHGLELVKQYPGIDGLMIGRGIFANPFCFEQRPKQHSQKELVKLLKYHLDLFDKYQKEKFEPLKKFFKIYVNNFPGAVELRAKLMETKNTDKAREVLKKAKL